MARGNLSWRTIGGWFLTVAWVAAAVYHVGVNVGWAGFVAMPPNEIGDSLAGFAAPLAFLWLLIGYHQQGAQLIGQDRAQRRSDFMRYAELMSLHQVQLAAALLNVTSSDVETNMAWVRFGQGDRDSIYGSIIEHGFRGKEDKVRDEISVIEPHRTRAVQYADNFEVLLRECVEADDRKAVLREFYERSMMGSVYAGLCIILERPVKFEVRSKPFTLSQII